MASTHIEDELTLPSLADSTTKHEVKNNKLNRLEALSALAAVADVDDVKPRTIKLTAELIVVKDIDLNIRTAFL